MYGSRGGDTIHVLYLFLSCHIPRVITKSQLSMMLDVIENCIQFFVTVY